jgi:dTDP-4-dehydrorhamnose 3,5-epimerase-like enzyme
MYVIENHSVDFIRAWQGHKIEQRWFSAVQGSFKIQLIAIDNWEKPNDSLPRLEYILKSETLDFLHVPAGYISSIQALEEKSKLVVMSDYHIGEIRDEFRYPTDYFIKE